MGSLDKKDDSWVQQADALLSQANPVSNTEYTVLDTKTKVKIELVYINITWAVTQPTNLRVIVTVDGKTITYTVASPVSGTSYYPTVTSTDDANQLLGTSVGSAQMIAFQNMSGKSVKITAAITWGVTQPTPLVCRAKYALRG